MLTNTCALLSLALLCSVSSQIGAQHLPHRMAYIETELAKRRGIDPSKPQEGEKEYDPQEELFRIAEKYRVEKKEAPDDEEGNVTTSMGMLTSIPEVDLGMEWVAVPSCCGRLRADSPWRRSVRLRNIEETEKAKRAMIEARKKGSGKKREEADQNFAAARCKRPQAASSIAWRWIRADRPDTPSLPAKLQSPV